MDPHATPERDGEEDGQRRGVTLRPFDVLYLGGRTFDEVHGSKESCVEATNEDLTVINRWSVREGL